MNENPYQQAPANPPLPRPPANPYASLHADPYASPRSSSRSQPSSSEGFNPYAPPSARADFGFGSSIYVAGDDAMLADRGARLGAVLVDGVLLAVAIFVGMIATSSLGDEGMLGGGMLGFLSLVGLQWYLISTTGQSLAKKWFGIRIVKLDGSLPGFVHGVMLRNWLTRALSIVPLIGSIIGLVDALMIFGDERRCLHDHIAGTKVVVAL